MVFVLIFDLIISIVGDTKLFQIMSNVGILLIGM